MPESLTERKYFGLDIGHTMRPHRHRGIWETRDQESLIRLDTGTRTRDDGRMAKRKSGACSVGRDKPASETSEVDGTSGFGDDEDSDYCPLVDRHRRFGRTCSLHPQDILNCIILLDVMSSRR
jgi:hypothetical protein